MLSLHELVKDGVNGLVFSGAPQLAEQLEVGIKLFTKVKGSRADQELLMSFPNSRRLAYLAESLKRVSSPQHIRSPRPAVAEEDPENWAWTDWEENWSRVMRPLILDDVNL